MLASASNAFALHDLLGRLAADPRPIASCLTPEGLSVVAYLALRLCERLELELGCCPCVRDPSPRGWRCSRCGRESSRPAGGRAVGVGEAGPGPAGEAPDPAVYPPLANRG